MQSKFAKVPERPDFPQEEEKVLEYWNEIDAFQQQMKRTEGKKPYTFYDGPPFATGLPHYGHIAAGTIKDVMTRYASMTGHHCQRRFGWDCHGLPIEYEIDKKYKIKSSLEREEIGVKEYNRRCREIVMTYSKEWETIIGRFGRWIDFKNDYKTMDCNYMESVWWTFKQIFDKNLVYRGSKIMPFSTACNTVLSNFEAGSNYKDTKDPAIYVSFPLVDDPTVNLIAWTTTPWTLPSNLALAVNSGFTYLKIHDEEKDKIYIIAEPRLKDVLKQTNIKKHKVLEKIKGSDLVGKSYTPLFDYFKEMKEQKCFTILDGKFVTEGAGTGVVHCAPGFGEEDYNVCISHGIVKPGKIIMPMDDDGKFTKSISDYEGIYFKDADPLITKALKDKGRLVASGTVTHSYPFCWRSQGPLMYRAVDTWFIKVTDIKQDLLKNNEDPTWVPAFVQEKRFKNWLNDARDWCFSRNRYWGNPIPIWVSDDMQEIICVGSIKELQELSGCGEITDLHRESVDQITIPSKQGKGVLRRIPEVFDCWFESGSMPYAQSHYPFSINDADFMKGFPANFIAEGLDQTRGWFYTLMVISTAVKGCAPFKNLIVNGIVLAEDGTKMSKSKQNYPDPMHITKSYGADACRLYLCNSPVVRAESLQFKEMGVKSVIREIFLPWYNAYRFLIQNISRYEAQNGANFTYDSKLSESLTSSSNLMDRWIISATQNMVKLVRAEMDAYRLYNVVKPLLSFLDQLTNWYVRLNRTRMKGEDGIKEQQQSLNILYEVLLTTSTLMSCITPFITEHMYQNLKNGLGEADKELNQESIHFLQIPQLNEKLLDDAIEQRVERMQSAIENGRLIRDRKNISLKTPLASVTLIDMDPVALKDFAEVEYYIKEELNCLELITESNEDAYVTYKCEPDNREIGSVLKKSYDKKMKKAIADLSSAQLREYLKNGSLMLGDVKIQSGWLKVEKVFNEKYSNNEEYAGASNMLSSVLLKTTMDDNLRQMGVSREITNKIQKLRKSVGISIDDQIEVFHSAPAGSLKDVLGNHSDKIRKAIKMPFLLDTFKQQGAIVIGQIDYELEEKKEAITLFICKPCVQLDEAEVKKAYPEVNMLSLRSYLNSFSQAALANEVASGSLKLKLDGKDLELKHKTHLYLSAKERE